MKKKQTDQNVDLGELPGDEAFVEIMERLPDGYFDIREVGVDAPALDGTRMFLVRRTSGPKAKRRRFSQWVSMKWTPRGT